MQSSIWVKHTCLTHARFCPLVVWFAVKVPSSFWWCSAPNNNDTTFVAQSKNKTSKKVRRRIMKYLHSKYESLSYFIVRYARISIVGGRFLMIFSRRSSTASCVCLCVAIESYACASPMWRVCLRKYTVTQPQFLCVYDGGEFVKFLH